MGIELAIFRCPDKYTRTNSSSVGLVYVETAQFRSDTIEFRDKVNVLEWLLATLTSTCGQSHRPLGSSEDLSSPSSPPPTSIIDMTQKSVIHSKKR